MSTVTYSVQGMTCGGCAKRVRTAIETEVPGLSEIHVDPAAGLVRITSEEPVADEAIEAAVGKTKYTYAGLVA
jgi:copper chaperone CopZ